MNGRRLPLLMANTDAYKGPFVPVHGLRGEINGEGLSDDDTVIALGLCPDGRSVVLGELNKDIVAVIFNVQTFAFVRAIRTHASGKPISVWAA